MKSAMLRVLKITSSVLTAMLVVLFSVSTAFAETEMTVNGKEVKEGSEISYTFFISDALNPVSGLEMSIYYDEKYLEYVKDSFKTPQIQNPVTNDSLPGEIIFNYSIVQGAPDFSKQTAIATAKFKVKSVEEVNTDISFYIRELYDDDFKSMPFKTFCSMSVDGNEVITSEKPVRNPNAKGGDVFAPGSSNVDGDGGTYGKGGSSVAAVSPSNGSGKTDISKILISVAVVVVVIAIAAVLIIRRNNPPAEE